MDLNKLERVLNEALGLAHITYMGQGTHRIRVRYPEGNTDVIDANLAIIGHSYNNKWDDNIYGVEPQYAVGGYVDGTDIEYDIEDVEIDDDNVPEGTEVLEIIKPLNEIEWEEEDVQPQD